MGHERFFIENMSMTGAKKVKLAKIFMPGRFYFKNEGSRNQIQCR